MWATTAFEMATISTNAGVPSCIRVPPEDVATSSGSRSRVARVTAATMRAGGGAPDGPAEEAELADDDGDVVSADAPGAGDTASSTPHRARARASCSA